MTTPTPARPQHPTDNFLDHRIPNYYQPQSGALVKDSQGVDHVAQEIGKLFQQSPTLQALHKQLNPLNITPPSFLASADLDYQRSAVQSWRSGSYPTLPQNEWPQVRISHRALVQKGVVYLDAQGQSPFYPKGHSFANPAGTAHHIALQMHGLDAHRERAHELNGLRQQFEAKAVIGKPYDVTADLDSMRKSADLARAKGHVQAWNAAVDVGMRNETFTTPAALAKTIPEGALYLRQNPEGFGKGNVLEPSVDFIKGVVPRTGLISWLAKAPKASDFYLNDQSAQQLGVFTRTKETDHQSYAETLLALATAKPVTQVFTVNAKALGLTSADLKASGLPQAFPYGLILKDSNTGKVLLQSNGLETPPKTHKPGHAASDADPLSLAQTDPALHQLLTAAQLPGDKALGAALGQLQQAAGNRLVSSHLPDAFAAPAGPVQTAHAMVR